MAEEMKATLVLMSTLAALALTAAQGRAQMAVPPPMPEAQMRSSTDLDQMLGPIALYPDPLIAEILPAATLPSEIVMADRYLQSGGDPNLIPQQGWDTSIQAMARYPEVLKWMDDNLAWTTAVGQAFEYQQQDVMDSVQRLRAQAQTMGNLESTAQQNVVVDDGSIEILPVNPEIMYVPVYQPDVVYYQRPYGTPFVTFGIGLSVGLWLNHDFDWHDHHVIVWHHAEPRPANWWSRRPGERRQVEESHATFWQPRNPQVAEHQNLDRGREPAPVHSTVTVIGNHANAPAAPQHQATPQHQAAPTRARPATGAFIGVQSSHETRNYSNRGQESRQTVTRPAAPAAHSGPATHSAPTGHETGPTKR